MSAPRQETSWLVAWAAKVLAPETFERTVLAAEADLAHELARAPDEGARRRLRRAAWRMRVAVIAGALAHDRKEARRGLAWWLLAVPLVAVLVGLVGLPLGHGVPVVPQLLFTALGLGLGAAMAMTPARALAYEAPAGGWIAIGVLALVPLTGATVGGATRWLAIGPLHVHVATLVLPFVALALTTLAARARGGHAALMFVAAQAALVGTADVVATLTWSLVMVAAMLPRWRWSVAAAALGVGAVALAAARDPMLAPSPIAEGVLATLAEVGPLALGAALAGLALAIVAPLTRLRARTHEARALAVGVALMLAVPLAASVWVAAPVPLVGYGGSTIVATYLALGALMAFAPRATPRRGDASPSARRSAP